MRQSGKPSEIPAEVERAAVAAIRNSSEVSERQAAVMRATAQRRTPIVSFQRTQGELLQAGPGQAEDLCSSSRRSKNKIVGRERSSRETFIEEAVLQRGHSRFTNSETQPMVQKVGDSLPASQGGAEAGQIPRIDYQEEEGRGYRSFDTAPERGTLSRKGSW